MTRYFNSFFVALSVIAVTCLSGCSTLTSAYDSVSDTVTGAFKSDGDKK
jgi:uncharacterized protein YceK